MQLHLQELLDAILSAAAEDGFLVLDEAHPFWAGLTFEEAARALGIAVATARVWWAYARAWLRIEIVRQRDRHPAHFSTAIHTA